MKRSTGGKRRHGSAGIDNEAHLSCKRRGSPQEELWTNSCKMIQFRPGITEIRVCTFQMSGKIPDSANVVSEPPFPYLSDPLFAICQYSYKLWFLAPAGANSSKSFRRGCASSRLDHGLKKCEKI